MLGFREDDKPTYCLSGQDTQKTKSFSSFEWLAEALELLRTPYHLLGLICLPEQRLRDSSFFTIYWGC